ncbi:hypothetical protein ACTA71_011163, partial [Dictyostelium dimigraforme]
MSFNGGVSIACKLPSPTLDQAFAHCPIFLTAASYEFGLFFNTNVDDHSLEPPTNHWLELLLKFICFTHLFATLFFNSVQLACIKPTFSIHSEPESNSSIGVEPMTNKLTAY